MLGLIDTSMDKLENIENAEFIDEAGRDFSIASYNIDFTDVFFGDVYKSQGYRGHS